jgi:hypothetical protein
MSIHAHKTGINKTTGQQSDAIYSTSLTGNWIPGTGVNTHFWDNQVGSGKNIRRINTVATGSSPSHWIFSGTNDYFGAASTSYGGDPFGVNTGSAFTLAQWFKNDSGVVHVAFSLVYSSSNIMKLIISQSGGTANKARLTVGSETPVEFDYTFADDTWYYISLVYAGSNVWSFFVNGSFVGSSTISTSGVNPAELQIGRDAGTSTYSGGTIKIGHVHVYSAALKNSQLRQNFLASHVINNTRVYGATYTA